MLSTFRSCAGTCKLIGHATHVITLCVCMCVYVCVYVCVCMCNRVMQLVASVCVCMSMTARQSPSEQIVFYYLLTEFKCLQCGLLCPASCTDRAIHAFPMTERSPNPEIFSSEL